MKALLAFALVALLGCSKVPGNKEEQLGDGPVLRTLGVRVNDGARSSLVHGLLEAPQGRRVVFYFRGDIDGKGPLTAPINGEKLDVSCKNGVCEELMFSIRWSDLALAEPVRATVLPAMGATVTRTPAKCIPDSACGRWKALLDAGLDTSRCNAVEAVYRGRKFLSVTLVGPLGKGPLMHLYAPSSGGPGVLAYDWETGDGHTIPGYIAGGHERGALTYDGKTVTVTFPGAVVGLRVRR